MRVRMYVRVIEINKLCLVQRGIAVGVFQVQHDQAAAFPVDPRAQLPAVRVLADPVHRLYHAVMVRLVFLIDVVLQGKSCN